MPICAVHRRLAGWIALVAVLLATLAPAISHALNQARSASAPSPWLSVCTAQGAQQVLPASAAADDEAGHLPGSAPWLEHCPCCGAHAPTLGLPPAAATSALDEALAHALPRAFLAAPRTLHAWSSAQARAPPLVA